MACTGTFSQVYEFIRTVEGLPQVIWVDSLRINKNGEHGEYVIGEINLVVFSDNLKSSNYIESNK
jgi:hypothetical protein